MLASKNISYTTFDYKFSQSFKDVSDSYKDIKLPHYVDETSDRKILIVLDYVPTEDLRTRKLLSGQTGDLLHTLERLANSIYRPAGKKEKFSWMACSFNAFRTAGKPKDFQQAAREEFKSRIEDIVLKYKPDTVIIFGDQAFRSILPDTVKLTDGAVAPWYGTPVTSTITLGKRSHTCKFFANISLNFVSQGTSSAAALIGYMARRLNNGLLGYNPYAIDSRRIEKHKSVVINTIAKFDKLLDILREHPIIAVDTETKNLNKVTNMLLTIQFAKCADYGYLIPIYHKDTPFNAKELKYIVRELKDFFEGQNSHKYHIYVNGNFDLNVLRTCLSCRYIANNLWDIFSGEYGLDENHKFLETVAGDYYYSLGNIAVQYGFTGYLTAAFGKKHRGSIATTDLSPELIKYATLDVVVPFLIHEKQIELAEHLGHTTYKTLVMEQCSDLIHGFSVMSTNGSLLDVGYLFRLQAPSSPIETVIQEMEMGLLSTNAAREANKVLSKNKGIPERTLFNSVGVKNLVLPGSSSNVIGQYADLSNNILSLRKADHKQLLFFDILKLDPIEKGVSGKGKLDKEFQKTYADVPEVAMYTALEKAKKLKNAFVKSFIKLLGSNEDLMSDHKIRPNYHYLKVISGRTSSSDPNLQQIPSHSKLAKHIKRLFIAPPGYLYLKVDYRVHEVRCWGIISKDKGIAELFFACKKLRDSYRLHPTDELKARLKAEADVHVMNAMYFFGVSLEEVLANDKFLRNAVKSVIFGLIYQMSMNSLAATLKKTLEYTLKLVGNFNKRFLNGMKWIEDTKKSARKFFFYENPLGFRRHMWGFCLPDSFPQAKSIYSQCSRQIVNSPIQGMAAQFAAIGNRLIQTALWDIRDREVDIKICNSVHDSLENLVAYKDFLEAIGLIEYALTEGVEQTVLKRYGFKFVVPLEIDFELGSDLSNCKEWSCSLHDLEQIVFEALCFQKFELGYDIKVLTILEDIMVRQLGKETTPLWMRKQAKNIKYKFDRTSFSSKYKEYKTSKVA